MKPFRVCLTLTIILGVVLGQESNGIPRREFRIDYERDQFVLDGQPFRYISGSLHYFRVLRVDWRDRLQKLRAAGLNAVSTYVEWSQHEPSHGVFDFSGDLDLLEFIQVAQDEGLLVLLRPGPYICAERDFGGFPPWLLTLNATMNLRSYESSYIGYVDEWLNKLMPMVNHLLYGNGGPIIMVQVENEYGSYGACDFDYTVWLRDRMKSFVGDAAVLYTTDGAGDGYLKCGKIQDVFATVDFGPGTNITKAFKSMRNHQPHGPLVNSEFYPGWLTHWEENWQHVSTASIVKTLEEMLQVNASVNFYVFAGGTNFGFTSGANYGNMYQPSVTSYDYDAPLTEAGDPTEKYLAIRTVIGKYLPLPDVPVPKPAVKGGYSAVDLQLIMNLFDEPLILALGRPPVTNVNPLKFEELGQRYGFILYEAVVPRSATDPALLEVPGIADRAIVFVDKIPVGVLSRAQKITNIPLLVNEGQKIQLFVENQGRINYGNKLKDFKGIIGDVKLSGTVLHGWTMTGFPLNDVSWLYNQTANLTSLLPAFLRGTFQLPQGKPLDTFLDMTGFGKGVVFINGHNLGRYWPKAGPISTLYVPAGYLLAHPATNILIVFELESIPVAPHRVHFKKKHTITSLYSNKTFR